VSKEDKLLQVYSIFNTAVCCHVVLDEGERRKKYFLVFLRLIEKWLKSEYWRCVGVFCAALDVDVKWVLNFMSIFFMVISRWWDGTEWVPTFQ
jgi:hypothetical protein